MKDKLSKLIDVKSIITLSLTGVFSFLAATNKISPEQFLTIFTMCISFFFGVKSGKGENTTDQDLK